MIYSTRVRRIAKCFCYLLPRFPKDSREVGLRKECISWKGNCKSYYVTGFHIDGITKNKVCFRSSICGNARQGTMMLSLKIEIFIQTVSIYFLPKQLSFFQLQLLDKKISTKASVILEILFVDSNKKSILENSFHRSLCSNQPSQFQHIFPLFLC